jgi:hypothetical protein
MDAKAFEDIMASLAPLPDEQAITVLAMCLRAISLSARIIAVGEWASKVTLLVDDEVALVVGEPETAKTKTSLRGDTHPVLKAAGRIGKALRGLFANQALELLLQSAAKHITVMGPSDEAT